MRVGIIGLGAIAPLHIDALLINGEDIVALCDVKTEKCEKAMQEYGLNVTIYSDYKKMLDEAKLDAVHICTPHYLHAEMICEGLRRGINVLSEKPLAINEEQLAQIEKAVNESSAQLGVCFQNRYNASTLYVKEVTEGEEFLSGSVSLIWERNADYYAQDKWRGTWDMEGGGVMINQAIHSLDLAQWFCGMPKSVTAHVDNVSLKGKIEVEDTAFAKFNLANGGAFIVNATNASYGSYSPCLMFQTNKKMIMMTGNHVIINGEYVEKKDVLAKTGKVEWGVGHIKLIRDYYDCIATGRKFPIGFYEAQNTIRLIRAMYKSNGNEITF